MANIYTYMEFINEEFFKRIFGKRKSNKKFKKIENDVENIINFLNDNEIYDWDDFLNMKTFDREVVKSLINHDKTKDESEEIYFRIRMELSNNQQLREYLKELENKEDFERCAIVLKKLSNR